MKENIIDETSYVKNWYNRNFDNVTSILNQTNKINNINNSININDDISVYNMNGILIWKGKNKDFFNNQSTIIIIRKNNNERNIKYANLR